MDEKLTKDMMTFVQLENPTDEQIIEAAQMLFKFNHNHSQYRQALCRPRTQLERIRYDLNNYLRPRLDGLTCAEVKKLEKTVMADVETLVKADDNTNETDDKKLGRREDHDDLPDNIKALWDKNGERFIKMKEAYATCQTLEDSCSRYEYLKIIQELYSKYKEDMARYDSWQPGEESDAALDAKKISAARSYISKYRKEYEELVAAGDSEAAKKLADNIQQRVNTLKEANAEISAKVLEWLAQYNFTV